MASTTTNINRTNRRSPGANVHTNVDLQAFKAALEHRDAMRTGAFYSEVRKPRQVVTRWDRKRERRAQREAK